MDKGIRTMKAANEGMLTTSGPPPLPLPPLLVLVLPAASIPLDSGATNGHLAVATGYGLPWAGSCQRQRAPVHAGLWHGMAHPHNVRATTMWS